MSGIHQTDTHSNSELVLGLKWLSESLRVQQGQLPPAWDWWTFVVWLDLKE